MNRTPRVRLGDWTCPSGNNVEAFYITLDAKQGALELEWDTPPPLLPADEVFYLGVIRPAIMQLVTHYTERTGRAVVVDV